MDTEIVLSFINNAALLLALTVLYHLSPLGSGRSIYLPEKVVYGIVLGLIGVAVMLTPWQFSAGIIFDSRSILLSLSGLFLGTVPTLVAVSITAVYRLWVGGPGALPGVTVIVVSAGVGLLWRHLRYRWRSSQPTFGELYLFGVIVHFLYLAALVLLPGRLEAVVLPEVTWPLMIVFPLATAGLGLLLVQQQRRRQMETAVRENEQQLRQIFETMPVLLQAVDEEGTIVAWNGACERASQYRAVDIVGKPDAWRQLYPDQQEQQALQANLKVQQPVAQSAEVKMRAKDGSLLTIDWHTLPGDVHMPDSQKWAVGIDITDRSRAEAALRVQKEMLQTIIDNLPVLIALFNEDQEIQFVNRAWLDTLIWDVPEILAAPDMLTIFYPDPELRREASDYMLLNKANWRDFPTMAKDDTVHDISWMNVHLPDGSAIGIGQNVTKRRQAERALAESEALLRTVMQAVPIGIWVLDDAYQVMMANAQGEEDLATLVGEEVGVQLTHIGERPLATLLSPPLEGEWHEVTANGRIFSLVTRPLQQERFDSSWVLVLREVTAERHVQEQLHRQEKLASIGQLAAGIAHDFNNILSVIVLYTQLLKMEKSLLDDKNRERLAIIQEQADRAAELVAQILDFSKQSLLARRPIDLRPLLEEQTTILARVLPENIEISLEVGSTACSVSADPTRIQQTIMNLALNARDAMPQGGRLTFSLGHMVLHEGGEAPVHAMSPGCWSYIKATDTGVGIAPDQLEHIFEPFFTTKEVGQGTGLGLAQVYGIVGQHGGYITVDSVVGAGSTFTIYLPAFQIKKDLLVSDSDTAVLQGGGEKLLVVEDEQVICTVLAEALMAWDYQVQTAANGEEALALLSAQEQEIALVISDIVMPKMSGPELLAASQKQGWGLPFIFLTGHSMSANLPNPLEEEDVYGVLTKPIDLTELVRLIGAVLRSQ